MNRDLPTQLAARLQQPLPGWAAQVRYQPELSFGRHMGPAPQDAKPAAVLVLLYPHADRWHIPLILRPDHMIDHASQVSLPGGVIEPGESSREAALREFVEELGATESEVQPLGELSELYLFASNFQISPWVATVDHYPAWNPNPQEVAELLEVPLSHLLDRAHSGSMARNQRGIDYSAPCFCWESQRIWGATSMILGELLAVLRDFDV